MSAATAIRAHISSTRRKPCWTGTPEIYFAKSIDNSRMVKVEDPTRGREMRQFATALGCLFLLVMTFAWQHYKAIEYGYKIEALKIQKDGLTDINRTLRMEDASLRDRVPIGEFCFLLRVEAEAGLRVFNRQDQIVNQCSRVHCVSPCLNSYLAEQAVRCGTLFLLLNFLHF